MLHRNRGIVLLLILLAALAPLSGCTLPAPPAQPAPVASAPTTPSPTLTPPTATARPTASATPPTTATPEPATPPPTPVAPAPIPTEEPLALDQDLGLGAGAARLAAALAAREPLSAARLAPADRADGQPALMGASPDGRLLVELIGPKEGLVTASVAALLPEGDAAAAQTARAALYQLIGAAMPSRAWAIAWLDERIEDALAGIPFSAAYEEHYVQVLRLESPQPYVHLAVTLAPRTLTLPGWDLVSAPVAAAVDPWDRLPIMPAALRGQRLPPDGIEMYEYTVDATVAEVEAYYQAEMAAQGWRLDERALMSNPDTPDQQQLVLVYRRGVEGAIVIVERYAAVHETLVTLGYAKDAADLPAIAG